MGIGKVSKILLLIVSLSLNFFNCNGADRLPGIQNQNLSGFPKEPSDHPLPEMTFSGRKNRHLTARLSYHHINFMITSHTVYPSFHRQGLSPEALGSYYLGRFATPACIRSYSISISFLVFAFILFNRLDTAWCVIGLPPFLTEISAATCSNVFCSP